METLSRIVERVRAGQDEFVRQLEAVARIDSQTENLPGVRAMGEWFGREFEALGFAVRWVDLPPEMGRAGHIVAERSGGRGRRLLLIGHLDTVLPGGAFRREGNRATGSGVSDMKGGNLVILHALRALRAIGALEDTRIIVCFTGDEESPGADLAVVRSDLIAAAKRSDIALAFEGAHENTVTLARRGITFWTLEVLGATGHSARIFAPTVGSGAVFEAARVLHEFHQQLRDEDGVTLNPALVAGGATTRMDDRRCEATGKPNIIASRAVVRGDLRFRSANQLMHVRERMEQIVACHLPGTRAELRFEDRYPAMEPTRESEALLQQLDVISRRLGHGPVVACDPCVRGAGDISFVAPFVPAIDGLGVRGCGEHTVDEDIDLDSVTMQIERAAVLIHELMR